MTKRGVSSRKMISSYKQILANAWENGDVYNPLLSEADIPGGWPLSGKLMWEVLAHHPNHSGIFVSIMSLILSIFRLPLQFVLAALPFIIVVLGFVVFIAWNGGIALGILILHSSILSYLLHMF